MHLGLQNRRHPTSNIRLLSLREVLIVRIKRVDVFATGEEKAIVPVGAADLLTACVEKKSGPQMHSEFRGTSIHGGYGPSFDTFLTPCSVTLTRPFPRPERESRTQ